MRYVLTLLLIACTLSSSFAQQTEFRYSFGGAGNEEGRSIANFGRKNFFIWGQSNSAPNAGKNNAVLIRTDSAGRTQVYREYFTPLGRELGYSMQLVDSALYLLGTTNNTDTLTDKLFLIKTNLNGDIIWQKFYETGVSQTYPLSLTHMPNGDWVAITSNNFRVAEMYRFDSTGAMLWRRKLTGNRSYSQFYCVRPTSDGKLAVSGAVDNKAYLAKLDNDGSVIWSLQYGPSEGLFSGKSFVELPNGDFFINGYTYVDERDLMMARVSSQGVLMWVKFYDRDNLSDVNYGSYLDSDGNVIITGYTFDNARPPNQDFVMAKFDPDGNFIWGKALSGPNDDFVDNGPDHIKAIGPNEYISMGASATQSGGANGLDFVLFRFSKETDSQCFSANYHLTSSFFEYTSSNPTTWVHETMPLLTPVAITLQTLDGDLCKRYSCTPDIQSFDNLGPNRSICTNSKDYPAVLDAGNFGATYLWSNGATTRTISTTLPGQYSVRVQSGCGVFTDTVQISFLSPPTAVPAIRASRSLALCPGDSVRLSVHAAPPGTTILWTGGSTDTSIVVKNTGSYVVRYYNAAGCFTESQLVRVVVTSPPPTPTISPASALQFCPGGSVRLRVAGGPGANAVRWSTGVADSAITVRDSGTYTATLVSAAGCSSQVSAPVRVGFFRAPIVNYIASGPLTFCDTGYIRFTAQNIITGDSLFWSNRDTTRSIIVYGRSSTVNLGITTPEGCRALGSPSVVTINGTPRTPRVFSDGPVNHCADVPLSIRVEGINIGDTILSGRNNEQFTHYLSPFNGQFPANISGNYYFVVKSQEGCLSDTAKISVTVYPLPPRPPITPNAPLAFCTGNQVRLAIPHPDTTNTLLWSTGATDTAIAVATSGQYSVRVQTPFGCKAYSDTVNVTAYPLPPIPTITPLGRTAFCADSTLTLQSGNTTATDTLLWSTGAGTPNITVDTSGSYTVRVSDVHGCRSTSAPLAVVVHPLPSRPSVVAEGPTTFCNGNQVRLRQAGADPGTRPLWSNAVADTSITVSATGAFAVTSTTPFGCHRTSDTAPVTVHPLPPVPVVTPTGATAFCDGGSVRLRVPGLLSTDTVLWSNGSSDTAITASASGQYGVRVTNRFGCVSQSALLPVSVYPLPAQPVLVPRTALTVCDGNTLRLAAPGVAAGNTIRWSDGSADTVLALTQSQAHVSFTVTTPDGCRATSDSVDVIVRPNPPARSILSLGPTTFCDGDSVRLTVGLYTGDTVRWTNASTDSSIIVRARGSYGLTVTNAVACSTVSAPVLVTVNRQPHVPVATTTSLAPICADPGAELFVDDIQAPDTLRWSTGDTSRTIRVSSAGTYTATVRTAAGCSAVSNPVVVHPNPVAATIATVGPATVCQPGSVRITVTSVGVGDTLRWLNGPDSLSFSTDTSGTFRLQSTNAFGCKAVSAPLTVTVLPIATVRVDSSGPLHFCKPKSVRLRLRGALPGSTVRWSGGVSDSTITIVDSFTAYAVVTNPNGCPSFSDTVQVVGWERPIRPTITADAPARLCFGERLDLFAGNIAPGTRILWSTGAADSLRIRIDTTGAYTVQVVDSNRCNSVSDTFAVRFYDPTLPTLIVTRSAQFPCSGDSVVLLADGPDPIRWNTGYIGRQIVTRASGTFVAQAGGVNTCLLPVSDTSRVTINPLPVVEAGPDADLCDDDQLTLGSQAEADVAYIWLPANQLSSANAAQPVLTALNTAADGAPQRSLYYYKAVYPQTGCSTKDSISITVHSRYELLANGLPYCLKDSIIIPNVITINGDGKNDAFRVEILQYYRESSLDVYNRYGQRVYSQSPFRNDWAAEGLTTGTYYFRLTIPGMGKTYNGWVEVIR